MQAESPEESLANETRCAECSLRGRELCPHINGNFTRSTKDPYIGKTLGERYKVLSLLGEGGWGRVYEVEHIDLRKRMALKVLHARFEHNKQQLQRFQLEAETVCRLDHPAICRVHDLVRGPDGTPCMVMEKLVGETLADRIARAPISVEETITLAQSICAALDFAHSAGIIHRDIKPSNIWLTTVGTVKVLDFGTAKVLEHGRHLTETGQTLGTPAYMSPEQARGQSPDRRCDIYALGCVMHECITGKPPFDGPSAFEVVFKHVHDEAPMFAPLSERSVAGGLQNIVSKCMEKDMEARFQNAADVKQCLDALAQGVAPTQFRKISAAKRTASGATNGLTKRLMIYFTVASVCAVGALVAALWPVIAPTIALYVDIPPFLRSFFGSKEEAAGQRARLEASRLIDSGQYDEAVSTLLPYAKLGSNLGVICIQHLAMVYGIQGKVNEAEKLCRLLGNDDVGTATNLHSTGFELDRRGFSKAARPLWERAIEINTRLFGSDSLPVAKDEYNLATVDARECLSEKALERLRRALPVLQRTAGMNSPLTVKCRETIETLQAGK